ncbi:MAG: DUF202 domain-containing protein [Pseudomonadota bacterium]
MINRYTDHAANERTYLAWIRTSIAIMAFGFLIEKFDLFISYMNDSIGRTTNIDASISAELAGLGLILVSTIMITASTIRFFMHQRAIESDKEVPYSAKRTNIVLSILMISLAIFLLTYLGHQISTLS